MLNHQKCSSEIAQICSLWIGQANKICVFFKCNHTSFLDPRLNGVSLCLQNCDELLQEFAITIEELTHSVFPTLQENHVCKGTGKAFVDSIGEWSVKWQLLMWDINKALRQTLDVEVIKLKVGFFTRLWETSDRALWRSQPGLKWKKRVCFWHYRGTGHFHKFCPHKLKE
jgi:hypothetical protein